MQGLHLILDCKVRPEYSYLLTDELYIGKVIKLTTKKLGMTLVQEPSLVKFPGENSGVTGNVIWAESHMAIHTWPELHYFSCDLFSCKLFSREEAITFLMNKFFIKDISVVGVYRSSDLKTLIHRVKVIK